MFGILVLVDLAWLNMSQKPSVLLASPGNRKLMPTMAMGFCLSFSILNDLCQESNSGLLIQERGSERVREVLSPAHVTATGHWFFTN